MDASISFKVSKVFANTHSVSSLCAVPTTGTGLLVRLWGKWMHLIQPTLIAFGYLGNQ